MARQPFAGVVSAVVAQERARKHLGPRVNVFINEKFSFALDAAIAFSHGLRPGLHITPQFLDELLRQDGDARAYARALHFLSYRLRSRAEVQARLERDEWPQTVIARVLQRLENEKLLNDSSFAAAWVENRSLYRPRGARALRYELSRKGVGREVIREAMPDEEQEIANAVEAARRKAREWSRYEGRERLEKALAFLQRRGFSFSVARNAMQRLKEEGED